MRKITKPPMPRQTRLTRCCILHEQVKVGQHVERHASATRATNTTMHNNPVFDPEFLRRGEDLQNLMFALLKGGLNKQARDSLGIAIAKFVHRAAAPALAGADSTLDGGSAIAVKSLRQMGYAVIDDIFSKAEIADIYAFVQDKKVKFGGFDEVHKPGEALVSELPPDARFGHYKTEDICRSKTIYRAVNNQRLIKTVTNYLGAPPTISSVSMWWSYPVALPAAGMQTYHHDRGDFRSCNLFVYLTDVTETTGPHAFVPQTHEIDVLAPLAAQKFGGNPKMHQKFWMWMEQHRKEDEEVNYFFPGGTKSFTGPQGTSFLEDTRGLHKGTAPKTGKRLVFEIVFSTLPKYNERFAPIPRSTLDFPPEIETDSAKMDPLVRYATRLMYV